MQLFNTDSCSKIKSKNHNMVIIDLEYFIDMVGYTGPETDFVKNNRNNLQDIMKKCVGDENYITGKSNDEIVKAFSSLLPIVSVDRLIITK